MLFKKHLIKFFIFLILFITFALKSFSLEPKEFVQSVVNDASSQQIIDEYQNTENINSIEISHPS